MLRLFCLGDLKRGKHGCSQTAQADQAFRHCLLRSQHPSAGHREDRHDDRYRRAQAGARQPKARVPGVWSITHKVKTNDADRTERLAHMLFEDYWDDESIGTEMFFVPDGMTVKQMSDAVRENDKLFVGHMEEEEAAKAAVLAAQSALDELHRRHKAALGIGLPLPATAEDEADPPE